MIQDNDENKELEVKSGKEGEVEGQGDGTKEKQPIVDIEIGKRPVTKTQQQKQKQVVKYIFPQIRKKRKVLSFQDQIESPKKLKQKQPPLENQQAQLQPQIKLKSNLKQTLKYPKPLTQQQTITSQLKEQYLSNIQIKGEELFELDYSYWKSSEIKKKLKRKKKEKIYQLLKLCRIDLLSDFQNLVKVPVEELIFVIKDFIAPHNMSINEIELLGIKTKNGHPLFRFHETKVKKDGKEFEVFVNLEQPIKIVERGHYEKNKGVFPFSTWHTIEVDKSK